MIVQKYIERIKKLEGKRRYFFSFIFGCLSGLSLPPVYMIPAAIVGFTAHLHQIEACTNKKQSFWLGWFYGLGFFVVGLYWISFALLVDVEQFGWMIPFAMFGIPAVLAIYTAIVSLITHKLKYTGYQRVILFAVIWTAFEMLRGIFFTGFPWNLIGYIWTVSDSMLQITGITGIFGLSFITVLAFAMPYCINRNGKKPAIIAFSVLLLTFGFGQLRLWNAENTFYHQKIRIVQGNIEQQNKWDEGYRSSIINKYLKMTVSKPFYAVKYVLWPESAIPYYLEADSFLTDAIGNVTPSGGFLITGSIRSERSELDFVGNIYNSIHTIDHNGTIISVYDKHHLVPFGEYVPLRSVLPIEKITPGQKDFTQGDGIKTTPVQGMPSFSPLVCYEAIFPNAVIDKSNPPDMMINVTNDAWYGNSSGPYQHFNTVRVRAVEHGIPLIRAANNGISGVIDPYGRVLEKTKYGEDAVLDAKIPHALKSPTLYTKFGNYLIVLIMLAMCGFVFITGKNSKLTV